MELQVMKLDRYRGRVQIKLNPKVAPYFKERISRLKSMCGDKVEVHSSHDIEWEDYQIIVE